jgi:putative photosynthetic complex assembly protein
MTIPLQALSVAEDSPAEPRVFSTRAVFTGVMIALAAVVATVVLQEPGVSIDSPHAPIVAQRLLRFEDTSSAAIVVFEQGMSVPVTQWQGERGFERGVLRTLNRERRIRGLPLNAPFLLVAYNNGRLSLSDPATGTRLDLESFGPDNAKVFQQLLVEAQQKNRTAKRAETGDQ